MQVAHVAEHLGGIGHVLVDVVEIGQQQLSPSVKMVECLVDARACHKTLVQVAGEFDGVADGQ